jgi:hypothetical protein
MSCLEYISIYNQKNDKLRLNFNARCPKFSLNFYFYNPFNFNEGSNIIINYSKFHAKYQY